MWVFFYNIFSEDAKYLLCLSPSHEPMVHNHIIDIIDMIQVLIDKGCAYNINGSVYFSVQSYSDYGKLSGRDIRKLKKFTRFDRNLDKRYEGDFVLWKYDPGYWDSPLGKGEAGMAY